MEESLMGFGLVFRGVLLHTQMDLADARLTVGAPNDLRMDFADARLTVGVPNDLRMERNLTGSVVELSRQMSLS